VLPKPNLYSVSQTTNFPTARFYSKAVILLAAVLSAQAASDTVGSGPVKPNRLISEKSPYLRQHAHNPVDWFPWGSEAFEKARRENKPIFLSVGYSTCHWCHVMADESFSDPAIAQLLNDQFVPIKVDREERPDVDQVYLTFVQASTGSGGWPMSVWLTPELKPFVGGTYYPPDDRDGRPGFKTMLTRIAALWAGDHEKILQQSERMLQALRADMQAVPSGALLPVADLRLRGFKEAAATFDEVNKGFGEAPKFPHPVMLEFLFDLAATSPDAAQRTEALRMTLQTLHALTAGGIHDQVGGGFHRYAVDALWRVPHFEKMLYDQAQLANACLTAGQFSPDPVFAETARDILGYVQRQMTDPAGGFYAAEDADSPLPSDPSKHSEGAFYLWTQNEIEKVLGQKNAAVFAFHYGVQPDGNVANDPDGSFAHRNILFLAHPVAETAARFHLTEDAARSLLATARRDLLAAQSLRPRPQRDEKVVTAWNGLMISAFARAAQILGDKACATIATQAAEFLRTRLYDPASGRLARSYCAGRRDEAGFAADYAFLIQGLIDLYETSFEVRWLEWAVQLQEKQNELFGDAAAGGFFTNTGADASVLLRLKVDADEAEPSPNSIAVRNLARLAGIMHREEWREMAARTARAFVPQLSRAPMALPQMLAALGWLESSPQQIIIQGEAASPDTARLIEEVWRRFLPRHVLLRIDRPSRPFFEAKVPFVAGLPDATGGAATAYVCENFVCQLPTRDPAVLVKLLTHPSPAVP
jgi:uncharacterized protein YyaL (SSP411 family)